MKQIDPRAFAQGHRYPVPGEGRKTFIHDRWHVLSTVKVVAKTLGLGEREITVLSAHLSVLAKGPVRSDQVLVSYAGLPALMERANCMDERRFRRGETRLEQAGLVRRKFSANARRFPVRDGSGQVIDAYGLDLRPLFERMPELCALHETLKSEVAELTAARTRISARLSEARRALVAHIGLVPDWLDDLATRARNILRRAKLTRIEVNALEQEVEGALQKTLSDTSEEAGKPSVPDRTAEDAGQIVRHSESKRKENITVPTSDLLAAWKNCKAISEFHDALPRDKEELMERLYHFAGYLGLSHATRLRLLGRLGAVKALSLCDYLAVRIVDVACPETYVGALLTRYDAGEPIAGGLIRRDV